MHPTTKKLLESLTDPKTSIVMRDADGAKVATMRLAGTVSGEKYDDFVEAIKRQTEALNGSAPKSLAKADNGNSVETTVKGKMTKEKALELLASHFGK